MALASRMGGLAVPRTPEFSRWSFSSASQERTRRTYIFPATRSFAAGGWATGFAKEPARRMLQACATARYACFMLVRRAGATFLTLRLGILLKGVRQLDGSKNSICSAVGISIVVPRTPFVKRVIVVWRFTTVLHTSANRSRPNRRKR